MCWETLSTFQTALVKYVECVLNGSAMQNEAKMHICHALYCVICFEGSFGEVFYGPTKASKRKRRRGCKCLYVCKPEVHSLSFVSFKLKKMKKKKKRENLLHLFPIGYFDPIL